MPRRPDLRSREAERDRRRREQQPWRRLYKTGRWQRLRQAIFLRDHYTCKSCGRLEHNTKRLVGDHIKAHKGDPALFFDPSNIQTLCKTCHDAAKQREEKGGTIIGSDINGRPIDPSHPWNA